jgi:uncharacterized protein YecT (DUF1311 family)
MIYFPAPMLAGSDCQQPATQAEINICAVISAKKADQALNQTYQKLKATLSAHQYKLLLDAQLSWIQFRDNHCALERSFEEGGTLSITTQLDCVKRMSDAREKELRSLLRSHHGFSTPSHSQDTLIGPDGIGVARIGMTTAQLKQRLDAHTVLLAKQRMMVDVEAIPMSREGIIQFYVLFPTGTSVKDTSVIKALLTTNPAYKTREGVGPGMLLSQAARLYGQPTLTYNTANESRETATFAGQPSGQIRFGVKVGVTSMAGVYAGPRKEYNQTQRYQDSAFISYVLVGVP